MSVIIHIRVYFYAINDDETYPIISTICMNTDQYLTHYNVVVSLLKKHLVKYSKYQNIQIKVGKKTFCRLKIVGKIIELNRHMVMKKNEHHKIIVV